MFQLPTDNLYKFLAISGLIVLGFSLVYPFKRLYEVNREVIQLGGEIEIFRLQNTEPCPPLEMQIRAQQLKTKVELERAAVEQMRFFKELIIVGGTAGAAMIIIGFGLWYRKVQKPQDLIIANQAASVKPDKSQELAEDSTSSDA